MNEGTLVYEIANNKKIYYIITSVREDFGAYVLYILNQKTFKQSDFFKKKTNTIYVYFTTFEKHFREAYYFCR